MMEHKGEDEMKCTYYKIEDQMDGSTNEGNYMGVKINFGGTPLSLHML